VLAIHLDERLGRVRVYPGEQGACAVGLTRIPRRSRCFDGATSSERSIAGERDGSFERGGGSRMRAA
jgi:hypothetical protein